MSLKPIALAVCCWGMVALPAFGQKNGEFEDHVLKDELGNELKYRVHLPSGYDEPGRSFPVVTWMHGSGGNIGSRPQPLLDSLQSGEHAAFLVEPHGRFHTCSGATAGSRHVYCEPGTTPSIDLLFQTFEEIETRYQTDPTKRVLTGFSRGGVSSFQLALLRPDYFSAIVPIQGGFDWRRWREPLQTRVWAMHGHDDGWLLPFYSSSTVDRLKQLGSDPIYLEPPGEHNAPFINSFFADVDDELYPWMFEGVEPTLAKLIYDPTDGGVLLDASSAPGGTISNWSLWAGRQSTSEPEISEINGDAIIFNSRGVISYEASTSEGFEGMVDLGSILPPDLDFTQLHERLRQFHYDSPAANTTKRPFRIVMSEQSEEEPLRLSIDEEPWLTYSVEQNERVRDLGLLDAASVGGRNSGKIFSKFQLPEVDPSYRLESATLRLYLSRLSGEASHVSVYHSTVDNDHEQEADDFFDQTYTDMGLILVSSNDDIRSYYDVDITEFIQNDYDRDADALVSAFRFELDAENQSEPGANRFSFAMPRNRTYFPHLALSFISADADCSEDAIINSSDLACIQSITARDLILTELELLPGDLNADGSVQFDDFLILTEHFGQEEANYTQGNIDLANGVDFADFLFLSANFGKAEGKATAVPEPAASPWIGLALIAAILRRRPAIR